MEVEQRSFMPLVFSTTGRMPEECKRFHSRLAKLLSIKKGEDYASTVSWLLVKVCFAILPSALCCLRGSRTKRKTVKVQKNDLSVENVMAAIM